MTTKDKLDIAYRVINNRESQRCKDISNNCKSSQRAKVASERAKDPEKFNEKLQEKLALSNSAFALYGRQAAEEEERGAPLLLAK